MAGQNRGYFLPTTQAWDPAQIGQMELNSPKFREFLVTITQQLNRIAEQVNSKASGYYGTQEMVTGETFFPDQNLTSASGTFPAGRPVFRKLICVGPLPNAATSPKTVAHGITVNSHFCLTRIFGCATDPVGLTGIPLPFTSGESPVRSVGISVDSTNIIIKVSPASDFTAYTHAYVCLEYIKNQT